MAALLLTGGCADAGASADTVVWDLTTVFPLRSEVVLHTREDDPVAHVTDVLAWGDRIAVVDYLQSNVKVFSRSGDLLMTLGRPGDGPGEFRVPLYAQLTPDGGIAVMDARSMLVTQFDSTGAYRHRWPVEGHFPGGFATSGESDTVVVSARSFVSRETKGPVPLHVYDWGGHRASSFGQVPEVQHRYEDMFNTIFVARLGRWIATVTYATDVITLYHLDRDEQRRISAGAGLYRAPAWPERNLSAADLREWRKEQVWTNKLIPMGDSLLLIRFATGVDEPHGYGLLAAEGGALLSLRAGGRAIDAVVEGAGYGVQLDSIGRARLFTYDVRPSWSWPVARTSEPSS